MKNIILYKNYTKENNCFYSYKVPEMVQAEKETCKIPEGWELEPCEMGDIFRAPDGIERLFDEVFFVDDCGRPGLAYEKEDGEVAEYLLEKL